MINPEVSPKRLQKSRHFDRALQEFKQRYRGAVKEGDRFLSSLYMDEIVQTILLQKGEAIEESTLRELLSQVATELGQTEEPESQYDIEIAVRKRFPERFSVEDIS